MYKIIGADGREYGPVPAETVLNWIRDRRADGNTRIMPEGAADWCTIRDLPEFAAALSQPPPMPTPSATVAPFPIPAGASGPTDPGPSPLPDDVGERDYDLDFGGCIGRAWSLVTGPTMWTVIGGVAVFLLIEFGISLFAQIPLLGLLFALASIAVNPALNGGLYAFMLRCVRGQPAEVGNLFDGFRYCFGQLFLGSLIVGLITFATMLPGVAMVVAGVIMMGQQVAIPAAIALLVVGGTAMIVPGLYLSVCWMFTIPLIMDKRLEFWPAMQLSRQVVRKHWWLVLGFMIVIGLLSAVGALLCMVGLFFTIPLGNAAMCQAYEILFSARPASPAAASRPMASSTI